MRKLELKDLAPYLPYNLKVQYIHTGKIDIIRSLYSIEDYDDIKIQIGWDDGEHIWMFKPILRPLSDLDKVIDLGDNTIFPLEVLGLNHNGSDDDSIYGYYISERTGMEDIYFITNKLVEWHFDVFGLIKKGLAIPKQ